MASLQKTQNPTNQPSYMDLIFKNPPHTQIFLSKSKQKDLPSLRYENTLQMHIQNSKQQRIQKLKTSRLNQKEGLLLQVSLKQYRSSEQNVQKMKKRLSILGIKDIKNQRRYQVNQQKLSFHNSIQQLKSIDKSHLQSYRQSSQQKISQQKYLNLKQKIIHHNRVEQIQELLQRDKQKTHQKRKEQAQQNRNRMIRNQLKDIQIKKDMATKIKQYQARKRRSLEIFYLGKQLQFKQKKVKMADQYQQKKKQKEDQLQRMMALQMEMIQRQSKSRMICQNSTTRLKKVLNPQFAIKDKKRNRQQKSVKNDLSLSGSQKSFENEKPSSPKQLSKPSYTTNISLPQILPARRHFSKIK